MIGGARRKYLLPLRPDFRRHRPKIRIKIAWAPGLDLQGSILSLGGVYDYSVTRKAIFNPAWSPTLIRTRAPESIPNEVVNQYRLWSSNSLHRRSCGSRTPEAPIRGHVASVLDQTSPLSRKSDEVPDVMRLRASDQCAQPSTLNSYVKKAEQA